MEILNKTRANNSHRERFEKVHSSDPVHGWYYDGREGKRLVWLTPEETQMTNNQLLAMVRALLVLES